MIGLAMSLAIIAAVIVVGIRRWQRTAARRQQPGATIHRAVRVARFDDIDAAIQEAACSCGGRWDPLGETSKRVGERLYRVVRVHCADCASEEFLHFDVTAAFH